MAEYDALDQSAWIMVLRSRGTGVHRIINQTSALNCDLSDNFDDSLGDTWTHHDCPMKIQRTIETTHLFKACDVAHCGCSIADRMDAT